MGGRIHGKIETVDHNAGVGEGCELLALSILLMSKIKRSAVFVTAIGCTLSINPQHPVDILCSNPFEVAAKVLHSPG
jgi:hypothetical protein